jgi:Holliday junction resolvasome RuvABC DNA-binding subunit
MLGSLTTKVHTSRKASVFFNRDAEAKKALFNQVLREPKRKFFGFDKKTEKIIQRSFIKFVEKELRKFNR